MAKRSRKSVPRKSTTKSKPRALPASSTRPRPSRAPTGDHSIEILARGVWLHESSVLLCRSLKKGYFYLPGGHVEFGESAGEALKREFLEEAGVQVITGPLRLVTEASFQTKKRWHHEINLVFHVEPRSSGAAPKSDSPLDGASKPPRVRSLEKDIGFEWVDLAAAVDLDIRPLAIKAWLAAGAGVDPAAAKSEWISEIHA